PAGPHPPAPGAFPPASVSAASGGHGRSTRATRAISPPAPLPIGWHARSSRPPAWRSHRPSAYIHLRGDNTPAPRNVDPSRRSESAPRPRRSDLAAVPSPSRTRLLSRQGTTVASIPKSPSFPSQDIREAPPLRARDHQARQSPTH